MIKLNVMVVDDSLLSVKKVGAIIEEMGHRVVRAVTNGAEAVEAYRACNPDLVTMDITMPDMDGIEATRLITQVFPDATIVMITSHGQEAMVLAALEAGAKGYVLKPVRAEKLAEVIAKVMRV